MFLERDKKTGSRSEEEMISPRKNFLDRIVPFMEKMSGPNIDYSHFFAKSVKRFSIPTQVFFNPFSDAVILLLKLQPELDKEESNLKRLVSYKNSLLIITDISYLVLVPKNKYLQIFKTYKIISILLN